MIAMSGTEWGSFKHQFPESKLYEKADYYVDSLIQDSVFALGERKEDFEAYLAQYPEGLFNAQARNKIDNFSNQARNADEEAIEIKNSFTDPDGKIYKVVKIGNQTWMAENLAYKSSSGNWAYNNEPSNIAKYGYLYDWETAKKVCPDGWRLPTKSDFEILLNHFDGSEAAYKGLITGGSSGFSALFGGTRDSNGDFSYKDGFTYFWSSSAYNADGIWGLYLYSSGYSNDQNADLISNNKNLGFSVRCLQDN